MSEEKAEMNVKAPEMTDEQKFKASEEVVKNYTVLSLGAGVIPFLFLDFVTLTTLQYFMLKKICRVYSVPVYDDKLKRIIAVLVGGMLPGVLARSLVKLVPIVGPVISVSTLPLLSGGSTYALGQLFVNHLRSGGTVLDCDPAKMKQAFAKHYEEAKQVIPGLKKSGAKKAAAAGELA